MLESDKRLEFKNRPPREHLAQSLTVGLAFIAAAVFLLILLGFSQCG